MSKVRQMAPAASAPYIAAGYFAREVRIWDIKREQLAATLNTILDFGGRRLALSPDGSLCVTGNWNEGVACYSIDRNSQQWSRPDLGGVNMVTFSARGDLLYCCTEKKTIALNAETGTASQDLPGLCGVFESPFPGVRILEDARGGVYHLEGDDIFEIKPTSFGLMDVAFSENTACISEASGPVRCFDLVNGREKWQFRTPGSHALRLAYCVKADSFYGALWNYETGGPATLVRFATESGETAILSTIQATCSFCCDGERLVNANGEIVETFSGNVLSRMR
jgi:outer membrane protein assembly factor BamB